MEGTFEFSSSAAAATTIMGSLSLPPGGPTLAGVDVVRIVGSEWELAEKLERGLSSAEQDLKKAPPLASLKARKDELSDLQKKYAAWLRGWRQGGGQRLTPPVLWQRLERIDKALKRLYQDVCDHIVFAEAEEEETVPMPPGKLEDLVRAAHQEEGEEGPR